MKKLIRRILYLGLVFSLISPSLSASKFYATGLPETGSEEQNTNSLNPENEEQEESLLLVADEEINDGEKTIVYLDLAAGNITFNKNTYTGYVFTDINGTKKTYENVSYSNDTHEFYIYQSNIKDNTGYIANSSFAPNMEEYTKYYFDDSFEASHLNGNYNVLDAIDKWQVAANEKGRTSTANQISFSGNGVVATITIDNVWSRNDVGLSIPASSSNTKKIQLKLAGDNRLNSIRYYTGTSDKDSNLSSTFEITSVNGTNSTEGSLTVIGNQAPTKSNGNYNDNYKNQYKETTGITPSGNVPNNQWDSAIGGNDTQQSVTGLKISGGTVYAGTTEYENCTAIGGGGNGIAILEFTGGNITAVSATTGTAIGGGIGHLSYGGNCNITISGGEVWAHNAGHRFGQTLDPGALANLQDGNVGAKTFLPGTAIGAGSSGISSGNSEIAVIKITGGTIHATSEGGCAIGAGNSIKEYGGAASVEISGGTIDARSIAKISTIDNRVELLAKPGAAIGGGSSIMKYGGSATVTISGGTIDAQSIPYNDNVNNLYADAGTAIGGGSSSSTKAKDNYGGFATVTITGGLVTANGIGGGTADVGSGGDASINISGGTIFADTIGGGFSSKQGYAYGTATVNGGSLNSQIAAVPYFDTNQDIQVFLTRAQVMNGDQPYANQKISTLNLKDFALNYGINDVQTDEDGYIYIWVPNGVAIQSVELAPNPLLRNISNDSYYAYDESDEDIDCKDVGVLRKDEGYSFSSLNLALSSYYDLYKTNQQTIIDSVLHLVTGTNYQYYLKVHDDNCTVQPYIAVDSATYGKIFQATAPMEKVSDKLFTSTVNVSKDTLVYFIVSINGEEHFVIDLANGNINITESANGGCTIEQNGYKLSGFSGDVYLTSGGYPTDNKVTVDCGEEEFGIYIDALNVCSDRNVFDILSGSINVSFSQKDNMITALEGSCIKLGDDAKLHFNIDGYDSLKLNSLANTSAIVGPGTLILEESGGFLKVNHDNNVLPKFSIGTYTYIGTTPKYTAELYNGIFKYELIGYLDGNNVLHPAKDMSSENKESFTARGVVKVFNGVKTKSQSIVDGNYQLKVEMENSDTTMGYYAIIDDDGTVLTTGYSYKDNTFVIDASSFESGNLFIVAAASNLIPYQSADYVVEYDGNPHGIIMITDTNKFKVYYSETPFGDNPNLEGLTPNQPITITNVSDSSKTVYWYIVGPEGDNYVPVSGHNIITINKAKNQWITDISCPDVVKGHIPDPNAVAQWGSVHYRFFEDINGNVQIEDISNLPVGTYYVQAYVEDNTNYEGLVSDIIHFTVFETSIYSMVGRQLSQIAVRNSLSVPTDGAITVRYVTTSEANTALVINKQIEVGTKITFINYPYIEGANPEFYYHFVHSNDYQDSTTIIPMNQFIKMGTMDVQFIPATVGQQVNYQFCIEMNTSLDGYEVSLAGMTSSSTYVQLLERKSIRYVEGYEPTASVVNNEIQIDMKIEAKGAANKYLIFRLPEGLCSDNQMIALMNTSDNKVVSPLIKGNMLIYDLGKSAFVSSFKLIISNVNPGNYNVLIDINALDLETPYYPLKDSTTKSLQINATKLVDTQLYVKLAEGESRVISSNDKVLKFNVLKYPNITLFSELHASLYKKNGLNYYKLSDSELILNEEDVKTIVHLPESYQLPEGIYRIVFTLNEETVNYNFIVKD